jgi:hypothetical protein
MVLGVNFGLMVFPMPLLTSRAVSDLLVRERVISSGLIQVKLYKSFPAPGAFPLMTFLLLNTLSDALHDLELIFSTTPLPRKFLIAFLLRAPFVVFLGDRCGLHSMFVFDVRTPAIPVHANNR